MFDDTEFAHPTAKLTPEEIEAWRRVQWRRIYDEIDPDRTTFAHAFKGKGPYFRGKRYDDLDALSADVHKAEAKLENIYLRPNGDSKQTNPSFITDDEVTHIIVLPIDADFDDRDEVIRHVKTRLRLAPSLHFWTSYGRGQSWLFLKKIIKLDPDLRSRKRFASRIWFKAQILAILEAHPDCDQSVHRLGQWLRTPGTKNKNSEWLCYLDEILSTFARYTPEEIFAAYPFTEELLDEAERRMKKARAKNKKARLKRINRKRVKRDKPPLQFLPNGKLGKGNGDADAESSGPRWRHFDKDAFSGSEEDGMLGVILESAIVRGTWIITGRDGNGKLFHHDLSKRKGWYCFICACREAGCSIRAVNAVSRMMGGKPEEKKAVARVYHEDNNARIFDDVKPSKTYEEEKGERGVSKDTFAAYCNYATSATTMRMCADIRNTAMKLTPLEADRVVELHLAKVACRRKPDSQVRRVVERYIEMIIANSHTRLDVTADMIPEICKEFGLTEDQLWDIHKKIRTQKLLQVIPAKHSPDGKMRTFYWAEALVEQAKYEVALEKYEAANPRIIDANVNTEINIDIVHNTNEVSGIPTSTHPPLPPHAKNNLNTDYYDNTLDGFFADGAEYLSALEQSDDTYVDIGAEDPFRFIPAEYVEGFDDNREPVEPVLGWVDDTPELETKVDLGSLYMPMRSTAYLPGFPGPSFEGDPDVQRERRRKAWEAAGGDWRKLRGPKPTREKYLEKLHRLYGNQHAVSEELRQREAALARLEEEWERKVGLSKSEPEVTS